MSLANHLRLFDWFRPTTTNHWYLCLSIKPQIDKESIKVYGFPCYKIKVQFDQYLYLEPTEEILIMPRFISKHWYDGQPIEYQPTEPK